MLTTESVIVDRNPHLTHIALHEFDEACLYCVSYLTDDPDFLAKYSFLKEAGEKVSTYGLNLQELGGLESFNVVKRAKSRVLEAVRYHRVSGPDPKLPIEVELLSFPVAAVLVKLLGEERLTIRYAQSEAIRVSNLLKGDSEENKKVLRFLFNRIYLGDPRYSDKGKLHPVSSSDVEASWNDAKYKFKIHVIQYHNFTEKFRGDSSWSWACNFDIPLDLGFVYLTYWRALRILQGGVEDLIVKRVREMEDPSARVPVQLLRIVDDIRKEVPPPPPPKPVDVSKPDRYPPCVLQALSLLFKGENLPHYSRLLLTTYLAKTGQSTEEVVELFSHSPDYNERMTRYQVEHLTGKRGGRVEYSPPSCRTLGTHGCCCRGKECGDIRHPLRFRTK